VPGKRLLVLSLKDHPSSRLRIGQYLQTLREDGFRVEEMSLESPRVGLTDLRRIAKALKGADIVFVQRIASMPLNRLLRSSNVRVVYDIDDALHVVRPSQMAGTRYPRSPKERLMVRYREVVRGSRYYGSRKRPIDQIASFADVLLVGNEFLYGQLPPRAGRTLILPTCVEIDARRLKVHAEHRPIRIGWIGLQDNLRELAILEPALRALRGRLGESVQLTVVSSRPYETTAIATEFVPWTLRTEAESVLRFDVGIMPLEDNVFARGKCAFKAIQCMSFGLPVVASPVGMNREVVNGGVNGFLADSTEEWVDRLARLAADSSLRSRLGEAAFETVRESYSLERGADVIREAIGGDA
jgi:glycosyltransferase involved in cell wall biosynthesis